ncbi:proton-conducting transporter transmembrane domain-containing protein [Thermococcus bergensis]|uniref:proton-conducting transporter transmembrane domain-containing protein n=1 Tax=Thermococcus bergensis TaxID=2689387 RepID=UPI0021F22B9E|nr:proton-conducting transporter membrane subunit [Thermococcus bergensis]
MSREVNVALGLAFTSLLLKSGIFPLHFWLPDAHSKADAPVSALLSGLVVKAPAYGMILLTLTFPINSFVQKMLLSLAFLSMFFGIAMAILQKKLREAFGISHCFTDGICTSRNSPLKSFGRRLLRPSPFSI